MAHQLTSLNIILEDFVVYLKMSDICIYYYHFRSVCMVGIRISVCSLKPLRVIKSLHLILLCSQPERSLSTCSIIPALVVPPLPRLGARTHTI